jgi:hypothetical protein
MQNIAASPSESSIPQKQLRIFVNGSAAAAHTHMARGCNGNCLHQFFDPSTSLFSLGLIVERITMNWFSVSNQKGAPRVTAIPVNNHPTIAKSIPIQRHGSSQLL